MSPQPPRRNISPPFLENDDDSLSRAEIEGPVPLGFHSKPLIQKYGSNEQFPQSLKEMQREMLIEQNDLDNQMQIYNNVELELQRLKAEELQR